MTSPAGPSVVGYRNLPPHPARVMGGARSSAFEPEMPMVSIVSICRNAETHIACCIESVAAQDYPNIEFIIFDGASTDGTLDILRRHDRDITLWVSEPDKGRADGFNKALAHATGDYLTAVMADDWLSPDFVSSSIAALRKPGIDYVFGDCMLHTPDGEQMYRRPGNPDFAKELRYCMTINSPSFTFRRSMLDELGLFNDISVASDYDWFVRADLAGNRGCYSPSVLYHFRAGGVSTTSAFKAYRENVAVALKHGAPKARVMRAYWRDVARHYTRSFLELILPANAVLALRRFRQRMRRWR